MVRVEHMQIARLTGHKDALFVQGIEHSKEALSLLFGFMREGALFVRIASPRSVEADSTPNLTSRVTYFLSRCIVVKFPSG